MIFLILLILGLVLRAALALNMGSVCGDICGDTAAFGLMAKHILELKEFPAYMPLAQYSGSFSAYVAAALFKFFGVSSAMLNMTAVLFSIAWMIVMFFIAKELLDRAGVIAAFALVTLPFHRIFIDYSLVIGNRTEDMLFISLALFILIRWVKSGYRSKRAVPMILGFFSGIALWTTPYSVPLLLTIAAVILFCGKKDVFYTAVFILAGFIAGYAPAIVHNFRYPFAVFFRMAGSVLDIDRSILTAADPAAVIIRQVIWKISQIPAAASRMPQLISALIGIPAAAAFIASIILVLKDHGFKKDAQRDAWYLLCIYVLCAILFYIILVQADRERYMAPLCVVAPLFIGYLFMRLKKSFRLLSIALLSALVLYNCHTIARSFPGSGTNRHSALAGFLVSKGLQYGFSDYETAYIAQFETKERSIVSPTLFHPTFCDRWPEDTKRVRKSPSIFYIINEEKYPEAALILEARCKLRSITYKKEEIKGFAVYYDFSSKIYPEQLPLPKIYKNG